MGWRGWVGEGKEEGQEHFGTELEGMDGWLHMGGIKRGPGSVCPGTNRAQRPRACKSSQSRLLGLPLVRAYKPWRSLRDRPREFRGRWFQGPTPRNLSSPGLVVASQFFSISSSDVRLALKHASASHLRRFLAPNPPGEGEERSETLPAEVQYSTMEKLLFMSRLGCGSVKLASSGCAGTCMIGIVLVQRPATPCGVRIDRHSVACTTI